MASLIFGAIGGCLSCTDKTKEKNTPVTTTAATRKQPRPAGGRATTTTTKPVTQANATTVNGNAPGNLGGSKPQMDPKQAAAKAAEERYQKATLSQTQSKQKLKEHQQRPKSEKALAN